MKILIATGIFPPETGGPASYVPAIARECLSRGHSVRVITYGAGRGGPAYAFPVVRVPRLFLPFRYFLFFAACLRHGYRTDVIFAQDASSSGLPAALAAFFLRKRFVIKIVGDFSWEYARNTGLYGGSLDDFQLRRAYPLIPAALRRIQRSVCGRASVIIVPSAYLKGIVAGWGVDAGKISVIHNAVTVLMPREPVSRDPFLVFSAGRLVPWKGFDGLIRAFAEASAAFPEARLVIAGDGPCRAELEAEARRAGVSDRVAFLGDVPSAVMPALYARAGCFVLFSSYEGFSHVLLEAVAYGVPVIASDAGGNPELITEGVDGILIPSGDEIALTKAIFPFFAYRHKAFPPFVSANASGPAWNKLIQKTLFLLKGNS